MENMRPILQAEVAAIIPNATTTEQTQVVDLILQKMRCASRDTMRYVDELYASSRVLHDEKSKIKTLLSRIWK